MEARFTARADTNLTAQRTWKLTHSDGSVEEFKDIRRKVGNQIIRAYLLEEILKDEYIERIDARLRGPKDEFKDFDAFLILTGSTQTGTFRILAESGVYENLRIVGTDSDFVLDASAEDVINMFTNAMQNPQDNGAKLIISEKSSVHT
ncbi:MAG: hypothetical protein RTV31_15675 [Candidatus Thorarchaeota archaeon]